MEDTKRWSVTYTKHIKQKRKVYQDGLLELHTHKVLLYDDCEKLLDSRFLKKDEVVGSGETLTFDAYLVDVGDPEGNHKPMSDLNFQGRDKKITEKSGLLHAQKFRNTSISVENRKASAEKNKVPPSKPSVSQKIIREFKKTELHKYGASQSCPDTTKSSITEWQALYTTQITQKAKKYHDGILRLAICGSQGRQVMLYDASRKLLDSRFLKKDEVIKSGESLTFDAHLVDIGEPERDHKPLIDLNVEERNSNVVGQTGILHGQQNHLKASKAVVRKWHALYTTQITQKAKKYHSGILKLAFCGSHQMQVTLLNEDGTTLSSKFLKLSEDVQSGSTVELPKYLVEVGEPWTSFGGESQNNISSGKDVDSNCTNSSVGKIKLSSSAPTSKPLRDAHEILCILKKPLGQESVLPIVKDAKNSRLCASEDHEDDFKALDEAITKEHTYRSEISESKAIHDDLASEFIKLADSNNKGELQPKTSTSSIFSIGPEASNILRPIFDDTNRSMSKSTSSIEGLQVLDAVILDFKDHTLPPRALVPFVGSNGNVGSGEFIDLSSSQEISSCPGSHFPQNDEVGNSHQCSLMQMTRELKLDGVRKLSLLVSQV
ncbi:hypothetical protein L1049_022795 [Liquidambar formosana]|uniref:5'-3' DNA helicase ZGRF1-like N-terminal domain-containing protein n=1 Tax=Liquidambar formosana TaxID=63359 RepID=A0AAP0WRQ6_LIQFO